MKQLMLLVLLCFASTAIAQPQVYLLGLHVKPGKSKSTFIFVLDQKTHGRIQYKNHQVLVELANTKPRFALHNARLENANVTSMTAKRLGKNLQVLFLVKDNIKWTLDFLPKEKSASAHVHLQLTLQSKTLTPAPKNEKKLLVATPPQKTKIKTAAIASEITAKLTSIQSQSKVNPKIFTVIIDPGHGGKDPGARGVFGTQEKKVVLEIARTLANQINQRKNMRAILTRRGDYFIPLRTRLKLARKGDADLFIAIHADAYFNKRARGASVYALSQRGATNEAARWLAQRENYSELGDLAFDSLQDSSPILRSVLIDLAQTATIQDSMRLGNSVLNSLKKISPLHLNHVAQAPFVVLKSPDIPSILIETGFISHPQEERKLASIRYQHKLANAIWQGIDQYVQKFAQNR